MTDLRKFNKGKPRLSDAEIEKRRLEAQRRYRQKIDRKNLSINGELLIKLNELKETKSKELGFKITVAQLIQLLINNAQ